MDTIHAALTSPIAWKVTGGTRELGEWTPDDDDFCCEWNGLSAQVEQMSDNDWFFIVDFPEGRFHCYERDVRAMTRDAAMMLCEFIMRLHLARKIEGRKR